MPSSSQYRSADTPDAVGGDPTTGAASPGRPGPGQAPPPVRVTNVLPAPGTGLDDHRVVQEPGQVRETGVGSGRAEIGVGEEPGELRGVQPDGGDPVTAGPVGAAGVVGVVGPLASSAAGSGSADTPGAPAAGTTTGGWVLYTTGRGGWPRVEIIQPSAMPTPATIPMTRPPTSSPRLRRRTARGLFRLGSGAGRLRHRGVIPFGRAPAGWTRQQATGRRPGRAGRAAAAHRGIALRSR